MKCDRCGYDRKNDEDNFCIICGNRLKPAEVDTESREEIEEIVSV